MEESSSDDNFTAEYVARAADGESLDMRSLVSSHSPGVAACVATAALVISLGAESMAQYRALQLGECASTEVAAH